VSDWREFMRDAQVLIAEAKKPNRNSQMRQLRPTPLKLRTPRKKRSKPLTLTDL
jgi:hypothetical protein